MTLGDFTPWPALLGGAMIGLATAGLWWLLGRLAGVSSILGALLTLSWKEMAWRLAFLAGLFLSGLIAKRLLPESVEFDLQAGMLQLVVAGALVGFGTQLGGGCTSGHGVCGISRFSPRSIVATLLFIAAGMATVYFWLHAA